MKCKGCEHISRDVFVHSHRDVVKCKRCGADMMRLFPSSSRYIGVKCFPSEGIFLEHVGPTGRRFHSEAEMRAYEKQTGATIARLH